MVGEKGADTEIQKQILKSLREFYPIKVDDIVLIAAVQKVIKDATVDQITKDIVVLRDSGLVEETIIKAPFGKTETKRLKITSTGIERLQGLEEKEVKGVVSAKEIESRLIETYDRIKGDLETMRQNLEASQKALEGEMNGVRTRIADHDQVIRTYFVRVIETFGVFVGIFAVVVVSMQASISGAIAAISATGDPLSFFLAMGGIALTLGVVIIAMLYGIRKLVLIPPKSQ
ncbi:MAG: hypothetical protein LUQ39_04855 [Methanomassiliicoccales archaeon]|jgi:hypothetical protein|nr:hypothetical protein [Methanomassiliicoccales archaeon]